MTRAAPFAHVALVGLGLIGSSLARAIRQVWPQVHISGVDRDDDVLARAEKLALCDSYAGDFSALGDADLVILCVPVGAMPSVIENMAPALGDTAIVTDCGSSKQSVVDAMRDHLPPGRFVAAHPVAGTEKSGPEAGFATLFDGRWCILTPDTDCPDAVRDSVASFWEGLGAKIEIMDAGHHDMVLAITSHLPHLIAYTIVGTASDLEDVTRSEVIKYSAGGFRDFTRIAASDPVMWRDVFLSNKDAVLEMLQRFSEDLTSLQRAIRWGKGDELEALFQRTRAIRRSILDEGQDADAPDFGRPHGDRLNSDD